MFALSLSHRSKSPPQRLDRLMKEGAHGASANNSSEEVILMTEFLILLSVGLIVLALDKAIDHWWK